MKIKKAVVIIPCLNEEKTVGKVINKLRIVSKNLKIKFIIIAIDDASGDNTINVLNKKADNVISFKKRKRLVEVIKKGLKEAIKHKPDVIVHIDADNQYDALELPKLFSVIENDEADFVMGDRDVLSLDHMPIIKKIGNLFFTFLVSIVTKKKLRDAQTGFRVMKYEVASKMNLISYYTYTQEEIIRVKQMRYRIKEVKVKFRKRVYGRSKVVRTPLTYGIYVLKDIIKIIIKK